MGSPNNALQTAIFTRLTGYAPLTALVGANVFDFAPASAQPPYVLIGDDTAIDWSTKGGSGWEATLTVHCWDFDRAGRKSVKRIMSAVYDALHRQEAAVAVAGFTLVEFAFEFETTVQDPSEVGDSDHFYHGVQRFRALIETTS